jgi:hypothetical protein
MAWENDLIRTTNEIARLDRRGGHKALARGAPPPGFTPTTTAFQSHVNTAIALLVAAGVDGEQAVAALRSIQGLLNPPPTTPGAGEAVATQPSLVKLPQPWDQPPGFFELLRDAKDAACELSRLHGERTAGRGRRLTFAAVGLVLLGVATAPVAVPIVGATGVAAAAVAAGGHILGAFGALIFVHNAHEAIMNP